MPSPAVSTEPSPARRAGVVGSPVGHSLSPVLHSAGFAALGLADWTYERIECDDAGLPGLVAGLGPEWAGLSITMPGKRAALMLADEVTERAAAVGVANTLVPIEGGWLADCTDVDGVTGAVRSAGGAVDGGRAVLVGAGGTAAAAIAGLTELGVTHVTVVARDPARATDVLDCADRLRLPATLVRWADADFGALARAAAIVVSTVPAGVADAVAEELALSSCVLDVIYHPWPTVLAEAVRRRGGRLATGLDMLLHQAFGQCELFTGQPAPKEQMRDALRRAVAPAPPLPL